MKGRKIQVGDMVMVRVPEFPMVVKYENSNETCEVQYGGSEEYLDNVPNEWLQPVTEIIRPGQIFRRPDGKDVFILKPDALDLEGQGWVVVENGAPFSLDSDTLRKYDLRYDPHME